MAKTARLYNKEIMWLNVLKNFNIDSIHIVLTGKAAE